MASVGQHIKNWILFWNDFAVPKICFHFEVCPNNFDRFINAAEIHPTYEFSTKMVTKCSSLNQLN